MHWKAIAMSLCRVRFLAHLLALPILRLLLLYAKDWYRSEKKHNISYSYKFPTIELLIPHIIHLLMKAPSDLDMDWVLDECFDIRYTMSVFCP